MGKKDICIHGTLDNAVNWEQYLDSKNSEESYLDSKCAATSVQAKTKTKVLTKTRINPRVREKEKGGNYEY